MPSEILIPLIAAIVGGLVAHLFSTRRDRVNKKRDKKIDYLIEAYRRLADSAHRNFDENTPEALAGFRDTFSKLESALSDIQLFGSPRQVELSQKFAREFAKTRSVGYDELLADLRSDLRKELNLPHVDPHIIHLRLRL